MTQRTLLMLLISVALAGVAAVSANRWMTDRMAVSAAGELIGVVAAAVEIPFGTKIDASSVKLIQLPSGSVPAAAFRDLTVVVGRVAVAPLAQGEVILAGRVVDLVGDSALASVVRGGQRAFTIQPNNLIGMPGFLVPGNRVDLIGPQRRPDGGTEARTFLRNIKVLAVDPPPAPDQKGMVVVRALTLEVSPAQAEQIVGATLAGAIQVSLRNPLEADSTEPIVAEPMAEPQAAAPAPVATPRRPPGTFPTVARPADPPEAGRGEPERVLVIRGTRWEQQYTGADFAKVVDPAGGDSQPPRPMAAAEAMARGAEQQMPAKQIIDAVNDKIR